MTNEKVEMDKHINDRYKDAINYYWKTSKSNKKWYKLTRSFTVILGSLVTLISSLSSSKLIENTPFGDFFVIGTPVIAACLTIIAGFSQSFQWGSTWQNMVLTAQLLQKEYDRYLVTIPSERDLFNEADILNKFLIKETESFFERMLGVGKSKIEIEKETEHAEQNG
jgi:hypothetical protein